MSQTPLIDARRREDGDWGFGKSCTMGWQNIVIDWAVVAALDVHHSDLSLKVASWWKHRDIPHFVFTLRSGFPPVSPSHLPCSKWWDRGEARHGAFLSKHMPAIDTPGPQCCVAWPPASQRCTITYHSCQPVSMFALSLPVLERPASCSASALWIFLLPPPFYV